MTEIPPKEARKLAAEIASLRADVERLKKGNRHSRLGHSSINAGSLIAGDTDDRHVQISKNGLVQREATGEVLTSFGAGSTRGNYLTIVDPDSGKSLASISENGTVSASGVQVSGDVVLNGESLVSIITNRPWGIQAIGSITANTPASINELGIFEISHTLRAGRLYKVCSSAIVARDGFTDIRVRYTDDGTQPTTASPLMTTAAILQDTTGTVSAIYGLNRTEDAEIRLLVSQASLDGGTIYVAPLPGTFGAQVWVEDIGPAPGMESGAPPVTGEQPIRQYTKTWSATWSEAYDDTRDTVFGDELFQGWTGNSLGTNTSAIGFDHDSISSALSGATIDKVEVYAYATYWYNNSGGYVCLGTHNELTVPGVYPSSVQTHLAHFHLPKPGGNWVDITSTTIGQALKDGTAKGLVFDASTHGSDLTYSGRFDGSTQDRSPALRITYTK